MMVSYATVFLALAASVNGLPLRKRIAQTIADATAKWEQACLTAGGGLQCNPVSVTALMTLLAAAGPCDQQNSADAMIDLAKTLNSDASMISLAQIFAQQARNTPTSQSVPYCQKAPKNPELNGLFQCQFAGANPKTFVGGIAVGGEGTIPFGMTAPLNPAGSCPANPNGPIPDGQQLSDITQNPGVGNVKPSNNAASSSSSSSSSPSAASGVPAKPSAAAPAMGATANNDNASSNSGSGFALQNGKDAQALNAKFASLTADSQCTDGDVACINGSFAKCNFGKFVLMPCAQTLTCMALPLVKSPGTSVTCTTVADAEARIAATGAQGGVSGNGAASVSSSSTDGDAATNSTPTTSCASAAASSTAAASNGSFQLQNGKAAQALNAKFAGLSESSTCTEGENACIDGKFAQCVSGKFVLTSCGQTLTCVALPLVNSAGTSVTCSTTTDAQARIAATGATGGLTGA